LRYRLLLSFKYRLKTSRKHAEILGGQLRLCRLAYNTLLGHCFDERKAGRGTPTSTSLNYLLPAMKTRTPELEEVHSQVLQNVSKRVRSGFESYWKRRKAGLKTHLPRFRRADKYNSLTYPQSGFSIIDGVLKLSKIGDVKLIQHRPLEGRVKTLTVTRSPSGKWYAVFSSEVENKPIPGRLPAVGVDFGLNSLVALSDGTLIEAPQSYRGAEERLGRAQRCLSRKRRGSRNREKARLRVASVCEKVASQRRDYAYKTARMIVDRFERVYVEDLKIKNMQRNRSLSKSIGDAGWGLLRNALTYMTHMSEGVTAFVNPRDTSQLCSGCGERVEKDLAVRVHVCPYCGLVLDRDVNAARNILRKGIGMEQPESKPEGEEASTMLGEGWQAALMKQEASLLVGR
jgi:putative transposase